MARFPLSEGTDALSARFCGDVAGNLSFIRVIKAELVDAKLDARRYSPRRDGLSFPPARCVIKDHSEFVACVLVIADRDDRFLRRNVMRTAKAAPKEEGYSRCLSRLDCDQSVPRSTCSCCAPSLSLSFICDHDRTNARVQFSLTGREVVAQYGGKASTRNSPHDKSRYTHLDPSDDAITIDFTGIPTVICRFYSVYVCTRASYE